MPELERSAGPKPSVDEQRRDPTADLVRLAATHAAMVAIPVFVVVAFASVLVALVAAVVVAAAVTLWRCRRIDERLARSLGARPVGRGESPRLESLAESVSMAVGVAEPRLHLIDDPGCNAVVWGAGTDAASIAVTTGLLEAIDRVSLEAVLARLLVDVRDGVVEGPTVTAALFGGVARGVLAGPIAELTRAALDERRVALGDVHAAGAVQYPPGLAAALGELRRLGGRDATAVRSSPRGMEPLWLASPLSTSDADDPFDVHPPLADRVQLLGEL